MAKLTQEELENRMYGDGILRADGAMKKAEEQGRAHHNPYAKSLFAEYVLPIAKVIAEDIADKKPGVRKAHVSLLTGLDPEAVSYLAIRYVLSNLLSTQPENHRGIVTGIGRTVHRELSLVQIQNEAPELFETISRDLGRRMSKSERHRHVLFMMQAKKRGLNVAEWNIGSREQVGFYLMGLLENAGLIELGTENRVGGAYKRATRTVSLHPDVVTELDKIRAYVSVTMPVFGPCVEPPIDWEFGVTGGFHTAKMRRAHSSLVHARRASRNLVRTTDMPVVFAAVNALQRTAWRVNDKMLSTVYDIAKAFSTKEIVSLSDTPAPPKPEWLKEDWTKAPKEEWPEDKQAEFKKWKLDMSEWYTQRKLLGMKYARFYSATRTAETFKEYPEIYFVYFSDSRGRVYPLTQGINPQGSDLSKALIYFAEAKPLTDDYAVKWFHVHGANKWGFDKETLQHRVNWVLERKDLILSFADDPVNNVGWLEASHPLQFLAWCFEYARYVRDPINFESRLPISMDGSCNGLQNLSALFRDEVGGRATNLTNNSEMEDIYANVAAAATMRLQALIPKDDKEAAFRDIWLKHGISRKAVKRSVMTTPYGVTERTATSYIISDYLREGLGPTFDPTEYYRAASLLMKCVWPAIGDVVVKGREAMNWLKKSARAIVSNMSNDPDVDGTITWVTPSGFPACQDYFKADIHRINTWLHGPIKIRLLTESDTPDKAQHAAGLAPNFVHSLDAAHLHLSTADASRSGINSLAMIHDDYGTHAADAQALFEIIRKQFVAMYLACDPVAQLIERYPCCPPPPEKGSLDIMEVLESDFFFS